MNILDRDDIPHTEWQSNSVHVIQDWGYTRDTGRFHEDYVWNVSVGGKHLGGHLGREYGIKSAIKYAEENNIETIYYSGARKSYFQSK